MKSVTKENKLASFFVSMIGSLLIITLASCIWRWFGYSDFQVMSSVFSQAQHDDYLVYAFLVTMSVAALLELSLTPRLVRLLETNPDEQ